MGKCRKKRYHYFLQESKNIKRRKCRKKRYHFIAIRAKTNRIMGGVPWKGTGYNPIKGLSQIKRAKCREKRYHIIRKGNLKR